MELRNEAHVLTQYLIGKNASEEVINLYLQALSILNIPLTEKEKLVWNRMLKNRFYLKLIDSGLAVVNKNSPIRKRIFLLLAILESQTQYSDAFFQKERSPWYLIQFTLSGMIAVFYMILGSIYLKLTYKNE